MGLTFSHVASLVIVTELQSLVDSCGSTAGHCGSKQTLKSQKGVLQLSLYAVVLHLKTHFDENKRIFQQFSMLNI